MQVYLHAAACRAPCRHAGVPVAVDVAGDDERVAHLLSGLALRRDGVAVQPVNLLSARTYKRYIW
jgi:hypothetical protein